MYQRPFYLTAPVGNNAFAYEARSKAYGGGPRLYVSSLVEGGLGDMQEGKEVVFEDLNEEGMLHSCVGLNHFVRTRFNEVPMVVVDNHNHVFYFWYEALKKGLLQAGATLIHVDEHKDMRSPPHLFQGDTLEEAFVYTNEVLNVGNYIVPAQEAKLVGDVQLVTGESGLEDFSYLSRPNRILNLDLDFFSEDLAYIPFEKARRFIRAHAEKASLITVATSPFFISQERALHYLRRLFCVIVGVFLSLSCSLFGLDSLPLPFWG